MIQCDSIDHDKSAPHRFRTQHWAHVDGRMGAAFQKLKEERGMTEGGVCKDEWQCRAGVGQEVDGMDLDDKGSPRRF